MANRTENESIFIQWNVQGVNTSKQDIIKLVDETNPTIIAVQETFLANDYVAKIAGYNCICKQGHYNRRYHGGVALYIHVSCPYNELTVNSTLQVVAATVNVDRRKTVTIASIYIPGATQVTEADLTNIIFQLPRPYILMGDFNAHHTMWGNSSTDRRGRLIENFMRNQQLNIMNSTEQTHVSGTAIDLTIVSPELTADLSWRTGDSVLSSDHLPIFVGLADRESVVPSTDSFNFGRANWKRYSEDPIWSRLPEYSDPDPGIAVDNLYDLFTELREMYVPKFKTGRFFPKPWWSSNCSRAWKEREKCYRTFKRTGRLEDKISWKRARAAATRTFREEKRLEWHEYVSKLNTSATSSEIWGQIKKIKGRPPRKVNTLECEGITYSTIPEIANKLAETLADITSGGSYSPEFQSRRTAAESNDIDFYSDNSESYNATFKISELNTAIQQTKDNSPGPDQIHNKMFRYMPLTARPYFLDVINVIWTKSYFDNRWRKAIVIPIPKPNKDHKNPMNYRPISLTSCLCKLIEKMVNNRIMNFLENSKFFAHVQCGFRKGRSTVDHLVRLETFMRKAIADSKHAAAVYFDMEKAYDKTWRYGIVKDLYDAGLRGRLPCFIREFLKDRSFRIRIGGEMSSEMIQETGVPQGSTLSVTLFAIKINSLYKAIPRNLFSSIYVDDIQIAFSHHNAEEMQNELQHGIEAISRWISDNGFSLSPTKTCAMQFYQGTAPMMKLELSLKGVSIPVTNTAKFLGLTWDSKLTWVPHITQLKDRCLKAMSLLRSVSSDRWGADCTTLMRLYRMLIRSKLDYGSVVYASATKTTLAMLDVVPNEAMRIATGAFRTTPVVSLEIITNEPPLYLRRQELTLKYYFKIKYHINSPAFSSVVNSDLLQYFKSKPSARSPFLVRADGILEEYGITTRPVLPRMTPKRMEHEIPPVATDLDMKFFDKNCTPSDILVGAHRDKLQEQYEDYHILYTDGSKGDVGVGAAVVAGSSKLSASLPEAASIFTAEMKAIQLALTLVKNYNAGKFVICSDSLSALTSLSSTSIDSELVIRTKLKCLELSEAGYEIIFCWIPSHCGIAGNEKADDEAKRAARRTAEFIPIPFKDYYNVIREKTYKVWREKWSLERKYLREITAEPMPKRTYPNIKGRRKEVVINRLLLGHCAATHRYLIEDRASPPPLCEWCEDDVMSLKHILVECRSLQLIRSRCFPGLSNEISLHSLLGDSSSVEKILKYVGDIGLYNLI